MTTLLQEFGIVVERVRANLDLADLIQAKAQLVFVDADFFESDRCEVIGIMRALVGKAVICVYAETGTADERAALLAAGADCVIPKSADEKEFGGMLLSVLAKQR